MNTINENLSTFKFIDKVKSESKTSAPKIYTQDELKEIQNLLRKNFNYSFEKNNNIKKPIQNENIQEIKYVNLWSEINKEILYLVYKIKKSTFSFLHKII